jgi:hypothetical protein
MKPTNSSSRVPGLESSRSTSRPTHFLANAFPAPAILFNELLRRIELSRDGAEHKQRELGRGLCQHIGSVGKGNSKPVGRRAVDVVYADCHLRDYAQATLPCFKDFFVDGIAQRSNERVYAAARLFDDKRFRRRIDLRIYLDLVSPLAQPVNSLPSDIGRSKYSYSIAGHNEGK